MKLELTMSTGCAKGMRVVAYQTRCRLVEVQNGGHPNNLKGNVDTLPLAS